MKRYKPFLSIRHIHFLVLGRKEHKMVSQPGDYAAVRKDIAAQLEKPGYDDGSAGPLFVRLAW